MKLFIQSNNINIIQQSLLEKAKVDVKETNWQSVFTLYIEFYIVRTTQS